MKLIINADDFGLSQTVNYAIFELFEKKTISSTTVMANMPFTEDVLKLLSFYNVSIGLHITLTQGKPISNPRKVPTLIGRDGNFFSKREFEKRAAAGIINIEDVYMEIKAQYDYLYSLIGDRLDHFDSHQGVNKIKIVSDALVKFVLEKRLKMGLRVYKKYYLIGSNDNPSIIHPNILYLRSFGFKRIAVEALIRHRVKKLNKHFFHPDGLLLIPTHKTLDLFQKLAEVNTNNFPNLILEIACHPATDVHDLPETKMKQSRVDEYELLKSDYFISKLRKIQLVNYSDLIRLRS